MLPENALDTSIELLAAIRDKEPVRRDALLERLKSPETDAILSDVFTEAEKLAFWLNTYNAFNMLSAAEGLQMDHKLSSGRFSDRFIGLGSYLLSLDEIEHGILRRLQFKYGLGYLKSPFFQSVLRKWQLNERIPEIHFALNCSAVSCPPVRFYKADTVLDELRTATKDYLEEHLRYVPEKKMMFMPAVMRWYRGDFASSGGIRAFIRSYGFDCPPQIRIRFSSFNYSPELFNFNS